MEDIRSRSFFRTGVRELRYIAAVLAIMVAAIHLLHPRLGAPRLIQHLQLGTLFDPRPLAFTLSAFLIVFGLLLAYNGLFTRRLYLAGAALMVMYLFGYGAWHTVLDHGGFWPHIHAHGHSDTGVIETIRIHLVDDSVAMISKILELTLLVALLVLYRVDGSDVDAVSE